MNFSLAWIPVLPLLGFLANGLWYVLAQSLLGTAKVRPKTPKVRAWITGSIASATILGAFFVSLALSNKAVSFVYFKIINL